MSSPKRLAGNLQPQIFISYYFYIFSKSILLEFIDLKFFPALFNHFLTLDLLYDATQNFST